MNIYTRFYTRFLLNCTIIMKLFYKKISNQLKIKKMFKA